MNLPKDLYLKQVEIGSMANYVYFIGDNNTKEVLVVDPTSDARQILNIVDNEKLKVVGIFITHGHYDHVGALDDLLVNLKVPVYISRFEADIYKPEVNNLIEVENNQLLKIGNIDIRCIHTPGHTPGCTCLFYGNCLITGDVLFVDGCGRCDLPGGDGKIMADSLYNIILKLPSSTIIYPGHNYSDKPFDTIENQRKTNPYLTCASKEDFLRKRMGF